MLSVPGVILFLVIIGSALGLSGSSTGMWWKLIHGAARDPNLVAGAPRPITSDMWLVQDSWIASQVAQGFPAVNHAFPGGMDATFMNDLPTWEWSTIFRPHLWAYLFLPLAQGGAWRWLFVGGLAAASVYMFAVSMLPRRPVLGLLVAGFVVSAPLIQWWYRPQTLLPLAWCFFTLTAIVWAVRARPGSRAPVVFAGLAGYFAVPAALTIYIPFIVPCLWVVLLFAIGAFLDAQRRLGTLSVFRRLLPLLLSGLVAALVLVVWATGRLDTIRATLATVYPGHRATPTGECQLHVESCTGTFAAAWSRSLSGGMSGFLGGNPAEASTIINLELYLFPVLLFLVVRSLRSHEFDWIAFTTSIGIVLFLAFILVPGWNPQADALGLGSSVGNRMRLGLLIFGVVSLVVVMARRDEQEWSPATNLGALVAVGLTALLVQGEVWWQLRSAAPAAMTASRVGRIAVVAIIVGAILCVSRRAWAGVAVLVVTSLVIAGNVNPVYRGWTDLRTTDIGRAVEWEESSNPGAWVGLNSGGSLATAAIPTGVLLATGVTTYDGVQTYPSDTMWSQIDPKNSYRDAWNRLGSVSWTAGQGEPTVSSPARDQIRVTFDSCSRFAQSHVRHVLALGTVSQRCLHLDQTVHEGGVRAYLYTVIDR